MEARQLWELGWDPSGSPCPPCPAVEMPWMFPTPRFRLFEVEDGGAPSSPPPPHSVEGFLALLEDDPLAAADMLAGLAGAGAWQGGAGDDLYTDCVMALCEQPLTVQGLEVMHLQVRSPGLDTACASHCVSHVVHSLESLGEVRGRVKAGRAAEVGPGTGAGMDGGVRSRNGAVDPGEGRLLTERGPADTPAMGLGPLCLPVPTPLPFRR